MPQAPRSMFGGFFGNAIPVVQRPGPLGMPAPAVAPTQYQAPAPQTVMPPALAQQGGFARTANGPVPMGAKGDCPVCR